MRDPRGWANRAGRTALLAGPALAALGAMVLLLGAGAVPGDMMDTHDLPVDQAKRLALSMLACGVAALGVLAGVVALALERNLEAPADRRGGLAISPARAEAPRADQDVGPLRKAA
jgi:hypothetical protein